MRNNHIKRFLSTALLLAFMMPSGLTASVYDAYSSVGTHSSNVMSLSTGRQLTNNNVPITLSLRDSDVKQVLRMFADKVGMNIVFHESVSGKITLDLVDMPINDAFNLVLQVSNLNYYKQNKTIVILSKESADNGNYSKQDMMLFPVKYVSAASISEFLNKNIFSMNKTGNLATINSATNELIVFGMPSDAAIVEKVIAQLDREPLSKTYTISHTTPAEMASLICDILLPSRGMVSGESGGDSSGGQGMDIPPTPGYGTGGAAGIMTGGAADAGSSAGGESTIKLGEGILACSSTQSDANGFSMQNLSISYFPQRGTITMIGGSEAQFAMVEKFIKENDIKQLQAYLELSIIELNEDGSKQFNNTWNIDSNNWLFSFSGSSTDVGRKATPGTRKLVEVSYVDPADPSTTKTGYIPQEQWFGGRSYISWQMNYLIENQKARVLANPKLLITNGQESTIDLTQDYVEKVTSEFLSTSSVGTSAVVQRTYTIGEDKGIKISLTPFISPDGYVTMNIKPEYAVEGGTVTTPGVADPETGKLTYDLQATLLNRRNLDLKNVRIKDGETLVLGGLIQEVEAKTVKKIPVLGDLPVIGSAFRSTQTQKSKSELVIMITPNIINDAEGAVADRL